MALSIRGKGVVAGPSGSDGQSSVPLAAGNLTTAAGSGLPLPRSELILAGKSIVRSMRRVTHGAGPRGKGDGDADQLMGDAARIGALASILDPAGGLVSLATAGAGADSDAAGPQDVLECLRLHLGQLGYMQGVLDENVCQVDGQLGGLDGLPEGAPAAPAPEKPADPASLSDEELRAVRSAWSARADVDFDAVIGAQQAMNDLDDRRRNLDHQVDALSDLLARLDDAGTTPVPRHLGDTLCYGLGWHLAGDSQRMASALRESRSQARASSMAGSGRDPGVSDLKSLVHGSARTGSVEAHRRALRRMGGGQQDRRRPAGDTPSPGRPAALVRLLRRPDRHPPATAGRAQGSGRHHQRDAPGPFGRVAAKGAAGEREADASG